MDWMVNITNGYVHKANITTPIKENNLYAVLTCLNACANSSIRSAQDIICKDKISLAIFSDILIK